MPFNFVLRPIINCRVQCLQNPTFILMPLMRPTKIDTLKNFGHIYMDVELQML
jgi:hypothetical protein